MKDKYKTITNKLDFLQRYFVCNDGNLTDKQIDKLAELFDTIEQLRDLFISEFLSK